MMMLRKKYLDTLEKNIKEIQKKFKFPKSMMMTMQDKLDYDNPIIFQISNEELVDKFVNKEGKEVNVKRQLRFIDRFMASSLDKLSSILKIDQFVNLKKYYSGNQLSLLLRKGIYSYDYVVCMEKLDKTNLPRKEVFYSKLTGKGITDEDYQHAHTVWKEFNIESMKDYHNLYNLSDVQLLTDIFENFEYFQKLSIQIFGFEFNSKTLNICKNHNGLDPAW